jgi:ribosomal protein L37AE/L43A
VEPAVKRVDLVTETIHRVRCPSCNKPGSTIDHLLGQNTTWGTWYCDACGRGYHGEVRNGVVYVEPVDDARVRTSVLLRLRPAKGETYFLVEGMRFARQSQGPDQDGDRYFYEEHTCEINWLRNVKALAIGGEPDPHALVDFVASWDGAPPYDSEPCDRALLDAIAKHGE